MNSDIRIALAQMNGLVGAVEAHTDKIIDWAIDARDRLKADLIVFPELTLVGYPPDDLLLRPALHSRIQTALTKLQSALKGIDVVIGYPEKMGNQLFNTAALIRDGHIVARYHKHYLPNYGVFDERRHFIPGPTAACLFEIKGMKAGLIICEDLWHPNPSLQVAQAGGRLLLCLNASPFDTQKQARRQALLTQRALDNQLTVLYVNWVGGQDELVFDGNTAVTNSEGLLCQRTPAFEETLMLTELLVTSSQNPLPSKLSVKTQPMPPELSQAELIYQALVVGLRDYVNKNNFPSVVMGLSGGIDSALALAIAVDALGPERVHTYMLHSRYTSQLSLDLATTLAGNLGVQHHRLSIEPAFKVLLKDLKSLSPNEPLSSMTQENLQARCRGLLLMGLSNQKKALLLSSSNKSELAVGYCTLYGDTAGGFNALKDLYKTQVYTLARHRNQRTPVIPQGIIDREPTAELAANQQDRQTLPPYPLLDAILERAIEHNESTDTLIQAGFDPLVVQKIVQRIARSEYKRYQASIGTRITTLAFGRERRYPVTSGYEPLL